MGLRRGSEKVVSRKVRQLQQTIDGVLQASAQLRAVVTRYEKANRRLATLIGKGVPVMEALEQIHANGLRPELSEAITDLESARHAGRLAICALAMEEGASQSDVARGLNFSRQLASRLAAEVQR
jgi:type II secretory pathway component PulF